MHFAFIRTRGQAGLDAPSITAEIHLSNGLLWIPSGWFVRYGMSRNAGSHSQCHYQLTP